MRPYRRSRNWRSALDGDANFARGIVKLENERGLTLPNLADAGLQHRGFSELKVRTEVVHIENSLDVLQGATDDGGDRGHAGEASGRQSRRARRLCPTTYKSHRMSRARR